MFMNFNLPQTFQHPEHRRPGSAACAGVFDFRGAGHGRPGRPPSEP